MPRYYLFERSVRKMYLSFGNPTSIEGDGREYCWRFGLAVLRVIQHPDDVTRCLIAYRLRDGARNHYAGSPRRQRHGGGQWSVRDIMAAFANAVSIDLDGAGYPSLTLSDNALPMLRTSMVTWRMVPETHVLLAWEVLRGNLDPALLLDALKHDTEVLG